MIYNTLMPTSPSRKSNFWPFAAIFVVLIAGGIYLYQWMSAATARIDGLQKSVLGLANSLASTTAVLQNNINLTSSSLASALSAQQQNVAAIQSQVGGVQNQVGNLSGTLTNIQKLSQIDPELLKKYSKVYFLSDNYAPANLSEIPDQYSYSSSKTLLFLTQALPHLEAMISAASSSGVQFYAFSAYRSFAEQKALKSEYQVTYGAGTANSFSADQGYSEHQLGTATDLIAPGQGGVLDGFDSTTAYKWLLANAYIYGFVLSYPKNNSYYVFEPWHWRFVGVKLATDLHNQNENFYDMDQRTIDTYLINLFD